MTVVGMIARRRPPEQVDVASVVNLDPTYGFIDSSAIRLTDGPSGEPRFTTYGTVYRANPWLWACVNTIARGVSRLPMKVFRDGPDDVRDRILPGRTSAAQRLAWALRRPGGDSGEVVSRRSLWYATTVDRLVRGNALWEIRKDRDGITGFERHPWRKVRVDEEMMLYRIVGRSRDDDRTFVPEDVVHYGLRVDDDNIVNTSPVRSLHATIALYDAVERHLTSFFEKGARPSGHVQVDKGARDQTIKAVRAEIEKLYAGAENAGRVLVTTGKWESITTAPDNSKVIELIKESREEICATYGVPPPLVGILDRAIMSNVRELRDHYVRDTVGPHSELMEGDFEAQVVDRDPRLVGIYTEFDLAAQLRPDVEARAKAFRDLRFVYSLNELRRRENLPPIDHPDADVPWIPLNEAPIDSREDDEPPNSPPVLPPDDDEEARRLETSLDDELDDEMAELVHNVATSVMKGRRNGRGGGA